MDEAASIKQATSCDAEIKLKDMKDKIGRLEAEKESRFVAEKAVVLKRSEALEEVGCLLSVMHVNGFLSSLQL